MAAYCAGQKRIILNTNDCLWSNLILGKLIPSDHRCGCDATVPTGESVAEQREDCTLSGRCFVGLSPGDSKRPIRGD